MADRPISEQALRLQALLRLQDEEQASLTEDEKRKQNMEMFAGKGDFIFEPGQVAAMETQLVVEEGVVLIETDPNQTVLDYLEKLADELGHFEQKVVAAYAGDPQWGHLKK